MINTTWKFLSDKETVKKIAETLYRMHEQTSRESSILKSLENQNYIFSRKLQYENLEHTLTVGDTQISYELMGDAEAELKEFYVLSQNDNATIYWTVSCFGGEIDEWLQMTFAE